MNIFYIKDDDKEYKLFVIEIKDEPFDTFCITLKIYKKNQLPCTELCLSVAEYGNILESKILGEPIKIEEYQMIFDDFVAENFVPLDKDFSYCKTCLAYPLCKTTLNKHEKIINQTIDYINNMLKKEDENEL